MSYRQLEQAVAQTSRALHANGIGRGQRLGVALPDSADTAVLMLSAMCVATVTPLNPRLTESEITNHLRNLRADAMVTSTDAARAAARELGLPTFELVGHELMASSTPSSHAPANDVRSCAGTDLALVAQTSGTTGRPKIVPLTQDNVLSMMLANCDVLGLSPADRCLSVMPLYHIHGLGAVLCSLLSGGSVAVAPGGFSADAFFDQLAEFRPSWYTAVPTIHQAVLDRAATRGDVVRPLAEGRTMRFVRSGSAPMPPGVPQRLEELFNTTYVEASGATEASAYICSNRPARRRIGAVGLPMPQTEVRIVDEQGNLLPAGAQGELVARGPGIFAGYENNAEATAAAFTADGFFRTGDLGRYDEDGFFYITGRVKEQINRGGMKVSPNEVDEVLLRHASVAQAVTFAMPDARLGEEVAAALVMRTGRAATELDIQRHVAELLADYKVPRRIVFVDEIPQGPSGKVVRIGLAEKLGLNGSAASHAAESSAKPANEPHTPTEQALAAVWSDALGRKVNDVDISFQSLGGDSLQAVGVSLAIERRFGRSMPLAALFSYPTIRATAKLLESDGWTAPPGAPVVLREGVRDERHTLFVLPGMGGNVYSYYALARHLPTAQRVVGLPLPGVDGLEEPLKSVEAIAERFVNLIRAEQAAGPYLIAGYSFGGRVAFEVARRLGADVGLLAMLDTPAPGWPKPLPWHWRAAKHVRRVARGDLTSPLRPILKRLRRRRVMGAGTTSNGGNVAAKLALAGLPADLLEGVLLPAHAGDAAVHARHRALVETYWRAAMAWRPAAIDAPITVLRAAKPCWTNCDVRDPKMGWGKFTRGEVAVESVPGSHGTLFHEPNVSAVAATLEKVLTTKARSHEAGVKRLAPAS